MIITDEIIDAISSAARDAGSRIMDFYSSPVEVRTKSDGSPVSLADEAAEEILLAALARVAPDIPVISEENAASHDSYAGERFFLVDPLDGTKEFLKRDGKGSFTVNVGLIENGQPVFGVVFAPALDRLFIGGDGMGAVEVTGGQRRRLTTRHPDKAPVAVASASHRDEETDNWLNEAGITSTVSIGSSLKFCLVASGEADVYPRFGPTMEWDTAAGAAVLHAAGGLVTKPDRSSFLYGKPGFRNGAFVAWGRYEAGI